MKSHPFTPSVTDLAQLHCNCSDDKSISVLQMQPRAASGSLSRQVARPTLTDPKWQTLVRT